MGRTAKTPSEYSISAPRERRQSAVASISRLVSGQRSVVCLSAQAEQIRRQARGEADAILMKMKAEADGMREMLTKQAEGFDQLVKASGGNANDAVRYMIADKLEQLTQIQVEAIKNLKIDKITVWDSNGAGNADGKTTTANFLSGIMKAVPPMNEMFDMAGMQLPEYLGKEKGTVDEQPSETVDE